MTTAVREPELRATNLAWVEENPRASGPGWLRELRHEALSRFRELGFPTPKQEAWKYTNLAPLARIPFRHPEPDGGPRPVDPAPWDLPASARIVFVNGVLRPDHGSTEGLPAGARVTSLRDALASRPEALEPHLARLAAFRDDPLTALNSAFLEEGALVELEAGVRVERPIHLLFLSAAAEHPTVSSPRNLILAGPGAEATVVETYAGPGGEISFTNAVTELSAGDGSVLRHVKLQQESAEAFHVGTLAASLGRDAVLRSFVASSGAALARNNVAVRFAAPGGECHLDGLFTGWGAQHADNHTLIDHAFPHCTSRELYKGILGGRARGVFHGRIVVRPDAQKTDAIQTNKNLLLSREALVDSTPALEIHADDVKCKHGSTIGQLDERSLFYLRSRGIGEREARGILTYAFAAEVTGRIPVAPVRERLEAMLRARFADGEAD